MNSGLGHKLDSVLNTMINGTDMIIYGVILLRKFTKYYK